MIHNERFGFLAILSDLIAACQPVIPAELGVLATIVPQAILSIAAVLRPFFQKFHPPSICVRPLYPATLSYWPQRFRHHDVDSS